MGYRVKGTLKLPDGTPGTNCEIEFTSRKNFTPMLTGMGVSIRTDSAGEYDVTLEYGAYAVMLRTGNTYPTAIGQIVVASDTVAGQDLPTLLEQSGWQPATPEYIQQITEWLERSESAATRSEASAIKSAEDGAAQADLAKSHADKAEFEADRASQITGLNTVADAIGLAALPLPDVWAPLSDSLRMVTGYGRDVLVGSDVVARMVSLSRNSTATYVGKDGFLKTAAVNEPRFEKEGLLIEGLSTNLVLNSKNPNPTSQEYTLKPVASRLGDVFKFAAANTSNTVKNFILTTLTQGKTVTISFIAKAEEIGSIVVALDGMFAATFNLKSGSVRGVPSGSSATITPIGDGFYMAKLTTTTTLNVTASLRLSNNGAFIADAVGDGMLIGNLQVEELPFATSYIQTNGAAVTRAAGFLGIPYAGNGAPSSDMQITMSAVIKTNLRVGESTALIDALDITPGSGVAVNADGFVVVSVFGVQWVSALKPDMTKAQVVAFTFNGATGAVALRVGNTVVTGNVVMPNALSRSAGSIGLLCRAGAESRTGYGTVRDFKIWHKFFSVEQLKAIK